jgi:hypothetical protein
MSTKYWTPQASARPQIDSITVSGTPAAGNTGTVEIGNSALVVTAQSGTTTTALVAAAIKNAINASNTTDNLVANEKRNAGGQQLPEFRDVIAEIDPTNTSIVLVKSKVPGWPFYDVGSTTLGVSSTGGGALTLAAASVQTATGRWHWNSDDNWTGGDGAAPADDDALVLANASDGPQFGLPTNLQTDDLRIDASFTGWFGLPIRNALGYTEYRTRYPVFYESNTGAGSNVLVTVGMGHGPGSPLINLEIDLQHASSTTSVYVHRTAKPQPKLSPSAFHYATDATGASNTFAIAQGYAGIGVDGKSAEITTIRVAGTDVELVLDNIAATAVNDYSQSGGRVISQGPQEAGNSYTNWKMYGGHATVNYLSIATANVYGGTLEILGSTSTSQGISTQLNIAGSGVVDLTNAIAEFSIAKCDVYAGATLLDPTQKATYSAGIDLNNCGVEEVTLRLGRHRRLTLGTVA